VFEDEHGRAHGHQSFAGRAVVFIHAEDSLEEQLEVVSAEAGLLGQVGADEALAEEELGDERLAAHGAELVFLLLGFP